MKILSLNCQKGHQSGNIDFLGRVVREARYVLILLQEVSSDMIFYLRENSFGYGVIAPHNEITDTYAQTVILYRSDYKLEKSLFFPVGQFIHKIPRREYGMTVAKFTHPRISQPLWVGSLHTHSGPRFWTRRKEVIYFKEKFLEEWENGEMKILGGDFNTGYPWEHTVNCSILAPEFTELTKGIRHTCDSKYLECSNWRTIALFYLGKIGINFRLTTDRVFIDKFSASRKHISWKLLKERISDHLPLEISIEEKIS